MASPDLTSTHMSPIEDIVGELKPSHLGAILEELAMGGVTLRACPRHERIQGLVHALHALKDEHAPTFQRLVTECADQISWSEEMTRFVLADALKLMSEPGLNALLHDELGPESTEDTFAANAWRASQRMLVAPEVVVHILSATVPTTAIEAIVLSIAAGVPCLVRTSNHERASGRFFLKILRETSPELAQHVAVVTWPHDDDQFALQLARYRPVVVFHGSDDSIQNFRRMLPQDLELHPFGHRISFGLVAPNEPLNQKKLEELADNIALDATLFEGGGCMSMQSLFVMPHPSQRNIAQKLAKLLVERSFPSLDRRFPRQPLSIEIAAEHMQQLGVAAFSGEALQGEHGNALIWREPGLRASPGWRHLHISTIPNLEALLDVIAPYRDTLSTAGVFMHTQQLQSAARILGQAGVRRICPIGRMQRPLLLRAHDGQLKVRPWFRTCDLEG